MKVKIIFLFSLLCCLGGVTAQQKTCKITGQVIQFKANEDGSLVMPPVYLPSPIYLFRSADGENTYKLEFTAYKNDEGASGHVKFKYSEIN